MVINTLAKYYIGIISCKQQNSITADKSSLKCFYDIVITSYIYDRNYCMLTHSRNMLTFLFLAMQLGLSCYWFTKLSTYHSYLRKMHSIIKKYIVLKTLTIHLYLTRRIIIHTATYMLYSKYYLCLSYFALLF